MAKEQPDNFEDARSQADAIYLLTRNGIVTTNFLEHNRGWFEENAKDTWGDDIADAYVASSYALLKNQRQADALIGRFHLVGAQLQAEDDYYNELGRDSMYIDLLAHHFPERLHRLHEADLMALAQSDHGRRLQHALGGAGDPGARRLRARGRHRAARR